MYQKSNDKAKQFTRGGQITFHNLRMLFQVNKNIWSLYFPALLFLIAACAYILTPSEVFWNAWYWCLAQISPTLELLGFKIGYFKVPLHGKVFSISSKTYLQHAYFVNLAKSIVPYLKMSIATGFILSSGVFYGLIKWMIHQGEKQTASRFIRGAQLDSPKNTAKLLKKKSAASDIVIDGMPLVAGSETKHFLVHGSTGSGKTQLISKLLDHLRRRGDRVFLYDKGGVYTSTFYQEGKDKILNPFDARCENWNLWHEARTQADFENMAESLIPMHGETDPFWVNAARTIFGSAAFTMQDDEERSIKKLLKLLLTSELQDLHGYLSETVAATLTSDKIEKTAISIRSVITTYLKSLRAMVAVEDSAKESKKKKPIFCIRDWLCNEKDDQNSGWLFLSSNAAQHVSLKPLLSMWFSMATITLLSLPENRDRRIWFICDELPSLHKLPQLSESIAEARKYGGCFVLGMQSYAQLEKVYGKSAGREIFDLMNTSFFFRNPSPDMAELVSRALGSQEYEDMRENYSYGANTIRDGISIGTQRMVNQIVSPSEIMGLEEMKCYLRLAGPYPITLLELELTKRGKAAEAFIERIIERDSVIDPLLEKYDSKVKDFNITKKTEVVNQDNEGEKVTQEASDNEAKNNDTTAIADSDDIPDDIIINQKQEVMPDV